MLTVIHLGDTNKAVLRDCHSVETLKAAIRTVITHSDAQIGKPGSAGYAYYRKHPGDIALAHAAAQQQLIILGAKACNV